MPGTLCDRVLLVGLGKEKEFREKEYCQAVRTAVKTLNETGSFDGVVFLTEIPVKNAPSAGVCARPPSSPRKRSTASIS